MKFNPVRYSSQVGEVWAHFMFKVKYCHEIFDDFAYRNACHGLFFKALRKYGIRCKDNELGFDNNHVHMVLDLGIKSKPQIAKELKGFVARKFFKLFPELKLSKHLGGKFWNSGLWSPATYGNSPTNLVFTVNYVKTQKYGSARDRAKQYRLTLFCD
ncbi:MAG: transposase [Candidatus Woesearchaeota archaeon]